MTNSPNNFLTLPFLLTAVVGTIVLTLIPISELTLLVSDDAYYYHLVAINWLEQGKPTFDGQNLSNGFHPLWMLLLLPIFSIFSEAPEAALKAVAVLQLCLQMSSLAMLVSLIRQRISKFASIIAIFLYLTFTPLFALFINGLESALLLFLITLTILLDDRYQLLNNDASLGKRCLLGLLLSLVALSRLDTVFILFGLAVVKLLPVLSANNSWHALYMLLRRYTPTVLVFILFITPYFLWNWSTFGHLTPISGQIKSSFPKVLWQGRLHNASLPYVVSLLGLTAAYIFYRWRKPAFIANRSDDIGPLNETLLVAVAIGCLIHLTWTRLFMVFGTYQWHFAAYIPILVIGYSLAAELFRRLIPWQAAYPTLVSLVVIVCISFNVFVLLKKGDHHGPRLNAAAWVRKNVPPGTGLALSDAGAFAFFNRRPTVNLDGVINSYEFQDEVGKGNLLVMLEKSNVKFIADAYGNCDYESQVVNVFSYKGKNWSKLVGTGLVFEPTDEVYSSLPFRYFGRKGTKTACFKIWALEEATVVPISPSR